MSLRHIVGCAALVVAVAGCYHATIETGLTPSQQTIEQSFASSWIYGLVPPKTVSTMAKCPSGVARVETQLSFVNQLVGAITFGIYTPMSIKVTCATGRNTAAADPRILHVLANAQPDVWQRVFQRAADVAVTNGSAMVSVVP